jgi:hypothetical protein
MSFSSYCDRHSNNPCHCYYDRFYVPSHGVVVHLGLFEEDYRNKNASCHGFSCPDERNTCHLSRVSTTSDILGRRSGLCFQHRTVMSHIGSVKSCSCGRSGSSRFQTILKTAAGGASSLNGWLPVKTLSRYSSRQTINPSTPDVWHKNARD